MTSNLTAESPKTATGVKNGQFKPKITIFHCFTDINEIAEPDGKNYTIDPVKMPCSSISREVFLLRAFEAGADAVVVLVCPLGTCRYIDGNIRAAKRVNRMKKLLDEIGLDGRRLNIFNVTQDDEKTVERIIKQTVVDLKELGPNPAA